MIYPNITHLLCRWHIDRYVCATDLLLGILYTCYTMYVLICRAWQRKLHSLVQVDAHKAEMYKYLWMLIKEEDKGNFTKNLDGFIQFWGSRQPRFVSYFKQNYACRSGTSHCMFLSLHFLYIYQIPKTILQVILVNSCNNVVSLEKWALSYRHFEHKDTDTNMFVKR